MKYKVVCFDMDGVLFTHDNFWYLMQKEYNTEHPGLELTKKYLKTDTMKLAELVIGGLWAGQKADGYYKLVMEAVYNPGVKEAIKEIKKKGLKIIIITSGPHDLALRAKNELEMDDFIANRVIIRNNVITGEYDWKMVYNGKDKVLAKYCEENGLKPEDFIMVGDNENDLSIFEIAGLAIAFNAESENLKKVADVVVDGNDLREILKYIE